MAKQIVAWCDVHMEKDEHVAASSLRLSLDGGPEKELDLCEPCIEQFVAPLRNLLQEVGQPVTSERSTGKGKPHTCSECGKGLASRDSLGKHLRKMHAMSLNDVSGDLEPIATPHACPECDRSFETPQGMGAHRNRQHGYISPARNDSEPALAI